MVRRKKYWTKVNSICLFFLISLRAKMIACACSAVPLPSILVSEIKLLVLVLQIKLMFKLYILCLLFLFFQFQRQLMKKAMVSEFVFYHFNCIVFLSKHLQQRLYFTYNVLFYFLFSQRCCASCSGRVLEAWLFPC